MEKIKDDKLKQYYIKKSDIESCISSKGLEFSVYRYKKGEQLTSPDKKLNEILLITEGTIRIYGFRNNGTVSPVNQQNAPVIIGDIEFSQQGNPPFFTDAVTDVVCVAVSLKKYAEILKNDVLFLRTLLHSYAQKLQFFAFVDAPAETIEDRVMLYLDKICPDHCLNGIEGAVLQLRCSRRQLQRVLSKLCQEGKVEKTGKGKYKLITTPKLPY